MKACPICAKGPVTGGGYSNRTRATQFNPTGKRLRQVNLQWAPLPEGSPAGRRIKICTTCIKGNKHLSHK